MSRGDILLVGHRDNPRYRTIGRIGQTIPLDEQDIETSPDAVRWEYNSESPYENILLLEELWEADLDTTEFLNVLGYKGFPNGSFHRIATDRDESTFTEEYGSIDEFFRTSRGR